MLVVLSGVGTMAGAMDVPEFNPECPRCRALLKIVQQLKARIKQIEQRLEKVDREGKRQAALFLKKRKAGTKERRGSGPAPSPSISGAAGR